MPLIFAQIAKNRLAWLLLVIFTGIAYGFLVIAFFLQLKSTYATFLCVGIIFPFAVIVAGDSKRLLLALLTILLPITVDITINPTVMVHETGTTGYIISLYDMVLAVLYLLWITELISKKQKNIEFYPEISLPAIFLIFFALLSAFAAKHPNLSVYATIEVAKMYLTFIYIANNISTKSELRFLFVCLLLGLFFEGVLGFAQHRYSEPFFPKSLGGPPRIDQRVMGTWLSPNDFAWYLTFVLPIAFGLLFSEINILFKLLCAFALVFGSAALAWTSSRAGWLSFGVASLFTAVLIMGKIRSNKKKFVNIFLALILALVFASPLGPRLYEKIYGRFTGDDHGSAESRFPQYKMAYRIIMDNPIIGVGINNYTKVMRQYDFSDEGIDSLTPHAVHNIFLHIGAEMGILGFVSFIWFIVVIFIKGIKSILLNEGFTAYSVVGVIGGILAFLIHGLVDVEPLGGKLYVFLWFFAGIICAVKRIKPEEQNLSS